MIIDCDKCGVTIFDVPGHKGEIQCPKCQSRVVIDWRTKRDHAATGFVIKVLDMQGVSYANRP